MLKLKRNLGAALAVARENAANLGLASRAALLRGDWTTGLAEASFGESLPLQINPDGTGGDAEHREADNQKSEIIPHHY